MRRVLALLVLLAFSSEAHAVTLAQINNYTPNTDIVATTGWNRSFTGTTPDIAPGGIKEYYLYSRQDTIDMNGYLIGLYVYIGNATVTSLKVRLWSPTFFASPSDSSATNVYNLQWTSDELVSQIVPNSWNVLYFAVPPYVEKGWGMSYLVNSPSGNVFDAVSVTSSLADGFHRTSIVTYNGQATNPATWQTTTGAYSHSSQTTIETAALMRAPSFVFFGDSLWSGATNAVGTACYNSAANANCGQQDLDQDRFCNTGKTASHFFENKTGLSIINMGISGGTSTTALERYISQVINLKPKAVVYEFGANDSGSLTLQQYMSNTSTMFDAFEAAGIQIIFMGVPSASAASMTNTRMTLMDSFQSSVRSILSAYPNSVFVEWQESTGTERVGGSPTPPVGNHWDLLPIYDSGDGIHENPYGYAHAADLIIAGISSYLPTPTEQIGHTTGLRPRWRSRGRTY